MFIQTISWKTFYVVLILSMILAYSQIEIYKTMNLFMFLLTKGSWVWIAYERKVLQITTGVVESERRWEMWAIKRWIGGSDNWFISQYR